ncbi:MAG: hypothetical protein JWN76_79 [Chitinophagaceae bacterium]|nr:hypothetical protein [Chitinophagaceae bacterium]
MVRPKNRAYFSYAWRRILQFFFQGVIVLAPIGITLYLVLWLFNSIDSILPNILNYLAPAFGKDDPLTPFRRIPGIGFILVISLVIIVGWLSSLFFVERIVEILDKILERTPGIKFIYSSIKDFLEAFTGNKRKFDKPVLVNVDANEVWRIGFITQKDAAHFSLPDHMVVYVPHSYAISGITYFVPKDRIKLLDINASEALKFVVSGGVTDLD